ncbi:uncharacterized protein M421DRAFT_249016 [Didymella exigua CBS 183.55]|uniref:Uncharacterized protein n=1 Tax=Didymella exigua CBS 183.55 TaxID=1150837 RepID=A0A6A5RWJ4_9PLEO|nr:uncharacterized protein M421DRAFT_249016 [Didymella exigua CBS 183.55]KAF1932771.1 hypothetical protein M421DRAFT_249016 [Didymella exigua CBS 183.55]
MSMLQARGIPDGRAEAKTRREGTHAYVPQNLRHLALPASPCLMPAPFHPPTARASTALNAHLFDVGFEYQPALSLHQRGRLKDQKGSARRL